MSFPLRDAEQPAQTSGDWAGQCQSVERRLLCVELLNTEPVLHRLGDVSCDLLRHLRALGRIREQFCTCLDATVEDSDLVFEYIIGA
jgi:hypothetical protein